MRKIIDIPIASSNLLISRLMDLSANEQYFCLLHSNQYPSNYALLAGWGVKNAINTSHFNEITAFFNENQDWKFGYFGYDLKNDIERLNSFNNDIIEASESCFFVPEFLVTNQNNKFQLNYFNEDEKKAKNYLKKILTDTTEKNSSSAKINIKARESLDEYLANVNHIKNHIKQGNIYESNYCTEFFATEVNIDSSALYSTLQKVSPTPFSSYFKANEIEIFSASPERFLSRNGNNIISQPIKGTARRDKNTETDNHIKKSLQESEKDRSENIMIVDLVRNDLSKIATKDSVKVDELCEIYSFPQVHQMISTISAEVDSTTDNVEIIKCCFPPGSMTGAPKLKAMELMETYEKTKRGIYSGALGYFAPNGNFDLSVVIRTIVYNSNKKTLNFMVGGAITDNSVAEKEYEECMLKASAMLRALNVNESTTTINAE